MRLKILGWMLCTATVCLIGRTACADGVSVRVGETGVQVDAATNTEFRLTVSVGGEAEAKKSIFLADNPIPPKNSEKVHDGDWTGVKTDTGELLVNAQTGHWKLLDAAGHPLIGESDLPTTEKDSRTGKPQMVWKIQPDGGGSYQYFGSGDVKEGDLVETHAEAHDGNGHAQVPYYWSSRGYSAFLVGDDDNRPGNWKQTDTGETWWVAGTSADLYLSTASTLAESTRDFVDLTGRPPVPPRWTFGYMQSRWGWADRAYIQDAQKQFIDRKLPIDAFIFDFEWFTPRPDYTLPQQGAGDYKDFSWNPKLFPDPPHDVAELHDAGIHFVGIRKPRLGNYDTLADFRRKGWILNHVNKGIDARVLDFANPEVRQWYADKLAPMLQNGIDGWWDDEGELTYTSYIYWNMAQRMALDKVNPNARLWTIDRAFQPGLQRFGAAAWTGDIHADWKTLAATPAWLLNWSNAGMFFDACDIGGFHGETNPQLLTRWMEAGVFFPEMRAHSENTVKPHFPWLWGSQAEDAIRKALDLRYQLIPMYYSLAHLAHDTGMPLMRPLIMEFPDDPAVANLSSQWMMGSGLMAAPILDQGDQRDVYLPAGDWYEFNTTHKLPGSTTIQAHADLDQIPVFVRAGTILPLGPIIQHTDDLPGGPLELQVYPGRDATFTLVEDDGMTNDYLKGAERRTTFTWDQAAKKLTWKVQGPYSGKYVFTTMNIRILDPSGEKTAQADLGKDGEQTFP